jgi:PAS domain-containing protein
LAEEWLAQMQAQNGWQKFQVQDFRRLRVKYGVSWVVLEQPGVTDLQCPYQNHAVKVCRVDWTRRNTNDRERVSKALAHAMQNQKPYVAEFRVMRADGTIRWVTDRGKFYYAANGNPERALGIGVDVTERKQAEEARLQQEAELKKTQHLAKVGAWQWDPEKDTVTWSEELYRIAGLDPNQPAPSYKLATGGGSVGSSGFVTDTIGDFFGGPGIRPGEPFNIQLAGKVIF